MEKNTVKIEDIEYTLDTKRLKYGQKIELENRIYKGLKLENNVMVVQNMEEIMQKSQSVCKDFAKIVLDLPETLDFDNLDIETATEIFDITNPVLSRFINIDYISKKN